MKSLMAALIAGAALFFAVPILAGGSMNICQDAVLQSGTSATDPAETRRPGTTYDVINNAVSPGNIGPQERDRQRQLHPHIPPVISCAADFWANI